MTKINRRYYYDENTNHYIYQYYDDLDEEWEDHGYWTIDPVCYYYEDEIPLMLTNNENLQFWGFIAIIIIIFIIFIFTPLCYISHCIY